MVLAWPKTDDETITHWEVRWNAAGGAFGAWAKVVLVEGRTNLSWSATGLRNNVSHRFEVRAVNLSGASAATAVTATPVAVPLRPQGLTATAGDGSVDLAWNGARDSTITSWEYRTGTAGDAGVAWDQAGWQAILNSDHTTVAHTIGSLTNGASLAFAIRAKNADGAGGASETVFATPRAPLSPVDLEINANNISVRTTSSITLTAQHPSLPREDEVWELRWKPEDQASFGAWLQTELPPGFKFLPGVKIEPLQGGTTYDIESRVVNPACRDDTLACPVNKFQGTTVKGTPALAAVPGDREVRLSWDVWSEDGFTLKGWELRYRAGVEAEYGEWQRLAGGASLRAHTVTGLLNGVEYLFQLRVFAGNPDNDDFRTDPSEAVRATPVSIAPAPTGVDAAPGDTEVTLFWDNPGNAAIVKWQIRHGKQGAAWGAWQNGPTPPSGPTPPAKISDKVTGLDNGAAYRFQVRVVVAAGTVTAAGAASDAVVETPQPPPGAPTGLTATPLGNAVELKWTGLPAGSSAAVGWQFRYGETGQSPGTWTLHPDAGAGDSSLIVAELTGGTAYEFELRAVGTVGPGAASAKVTATAGALPTALELYFLLTPPQLYWEDPDVSVGVLHYEYRQETAGENPEWQAIDAGDISYKDGDTHFALPDGLARGTEHRFRVRAVNAFGPGPDGSVARFVFTPPINGFRVTPRDGRVELSWANAGDPYILAWKYSWSGFTGWDHTLNEGKGNPSRRSGNRDGPWIRFGDANTNRHTIAGLPNNVVIARRLTNLVYEVCLAIETEWDSHGSETCIGNIDLGSKPVAPANFTAEGGDRRVRLQWTDPQDTTIERWKLRRQAGSGAFTDWAEIEPDGGGATSFEYILRGLKNDTDYSVELRAVNRFDPGSVASATATAAEDANRLAAPTGIEVLANRLTPGQFVYTWNGAQVGSKRVWQARVGEIASFGAAKWFDVVPGSIHYRTNAGTPLYATGFSHATKTNVPIRVEVREIGWAGSGDAASLEVTLPASVPDAPTGLTATAENGQIRLEWDDPEDPAINLYEVLWYHYDSNGVRINTTPQIVEIDGVRGSVPVTRHTVTGLNNGDRYGFQLRAHNSLGGGALAAEVFETPTTSALAAPDGFNVLAQGDRTVTLGWTRDGTVTSWQIRYNFGADGNPVETVWKDVPGSNRFSNRYTVRNLTNGVAYRFWLRAVGGAGTVGSESAPVDASPFGPPAQPTGLEATAGKESVTLGWDDLADETVDVWEARIRPEGADWGDWEPIADSDSDTVGTTFEGLTGGITHGFQIRAANPTFGGGVRLGGGRGDADRGPAGPADGLCRRGRGRRRHPLLGRPGRRLDHRLGVAAEGENGPRLRPLEAGSGEPAPTPPASGSETSPTALPTASRCAP